MDDYDHGNVSAFETQRRLVLPNGDNVGRYLVRRNDSAYIISYVHRDHKTRQEAVKHMVLPSKKTHSILKNNPSLSSVQDIVMFFESSLREKLLHPVSNKNYFNLDDLKPRFFNKETCQICEEKMKKNINHLQIHQVVFCPECKNLMYKGEYRYHQCGDIIHQEHTGKPVSFQQHVNAVHLQPAETQDNLSTVLSKIEMDDYDHGNISALEAERRLVLPNSNNNGRYLVRRSDRTRLTTLYIISHVHRYDKTRHEVVKHMVLPSQKNHSILKSNPSLSSVQDIVTFFESSLREKLLHPVSNKNYSNLNDDIEPRIFNKEMCQVCEKKIGKDMSNHQQEHREAFCPECKNLVYKYEYQIIYAETLSISVSSVISKQVNKHVSNGM